MHQRILLILLLVYPLFGIAQNQTAIWYFGKNAGIDFSSGAPVILLDGAINQNEGCSCLSDHTGAILLYTDGRTIYNKSHSTVENGSGLSGHASSTQSGLIVPQPGSEDIIYVFSVGAEINTDGITYSIVDISQNNGLGVVTEKNIPLIAPSEEKITAVKHANNNDYWVVTHTWNTNNFYSFLINNDGLNLTPVISSSGPIHIGEECHGYLKLSPQGDKIAIVTRFNDSFMLYDFNNETGVVSNPITFPAMGLCYGLEFSPDGTKLYVTRYGNGSNLFQYDLSSSDPATIVASQTIVGSVSTQYIGAAQLAPDGKIYITKTHSLIGEHYLAVVNNPNELGIACNFEASGLYLQTGKAVWGLPNFIQSSLLQECEGSYSFDGHCTGELVNYYAEHETQADSVNWDFGDPISGEHNTSSEYNPTHIYNLPGKYITTLTTFMFNTSCQYSDTIEIFPSLSDIVTDTVYICENETNTIHIPDTLSCLWYDGSTENYHSFEEEGAYSVTLEGTFKCPSEEIINIIFAPSPQFSLGNDTIICNGEYLTLYIPANLYQYRWQDGSSDPWMVAREQGLYWVEITNQEGCSNRDSLYLTLSAPSLQLAADTLLCDNDSLYLIAGPDIFTYQWNNGSSDTAQWIFEPGIVSVTALDSLGCSAEAQTLIQHLDAPNIFLPPDTAFCSNTPITLRIDAPHSEILWNNGETSEEITPTQPGLYHVVAENRCGVDSDSVWVEIYEIPTVDLGPDTVLFPGSTTTLSAGEGFVTYLWSNGFSSPEIQLSEPGTYYVEVWDQHCANTDTLNIKLINPLRVPNVFTPNSDGYNDEFEILGEYLQRFHLTIINRWGETLFESFDINNRWQGTHNNTPCADGVYFWIIRYQYPTNERSITIQGTVTILRN